MRAVEEAVFAGGVTAEALMDAVGRRIAARVLTVVRADGRDRADLRGQRQQRRRRARGGGGFGRGQVSRCPLAAGAGRPRRARRTGAQETWRAADPERIPRLTAEQARAMPTAADRRRRPARHRRDGRTARADQERRARDQRTAPHPGRVRHRHRHADRPRRRNGRGRPRRRDRRRNADRRLPQNRVARRPGGELTSAGCTSSNCRSSPTARNTPPTPPRGAR